MNEKYQQCVKELYLTKCDEVDYREIHTQLLIAKEDILSARLLANSHHWNSSYKLYYDALHALVEAFLHFDLIKASNHLCLFVSLCVNYPRLDLSWNFFEKIRTKRNGINYRGEMIHEQDWKEIHLGVELYYETLRKAIESRLEDETSFRT